MRLKLVSSSEAQKKLFDWLMSAGGQKTVVEPLLLAAEAWQEFVRYPDRHLVEALRYELARLLGEIDSDFLMRGIIRIPSSVFFLALAAYNCEAVNLIQKPAKEVLSWNERVLEMVPPATDKYELLAYHAVLSHMVIGQEKRPERQQNFRAAVLARSPVTELLFLDRHTPAALESLAMELLPGWIQSEQLASFPLNEMDDWLKRVVMLLQDRSLERWLRYIWLEMPETRVSCRNLGLLFEALHRRGGLENLLLEFYEAYDYFGRQSAAAGEEENFCWPVLELTARLLRFNSNAAGLEATRLLNRFGHEYLLKFLPLIEIIIARQGIPAEYRALSRKLVQDYLRPLLDYVAEGTGQHLVFGQVNYAGDLA